MFHREASIPLKYSSSLLANNLSYFHQKSIHISEDYNNFQYASIHKNIVSITRPYLPQERQLAHILFKPETIPPVFEAWGNAVNPLVLQAKWCSINNTHLMVLCCSHAVQIYSGDTNNLLYTLPLLYATPTDQFPNAKCVASSNNTLYIGLGNNDIIALQMNGTTSSEKFRITATLQGHSGPISALYSNDTGDVISGDERGMACFWKDLNSAGETVKPSGVIFKGNESSVTAVCLSPIHIIVSYGNGHLRLYKLENMELEFEVAAHAKWITSLDFCAARNLILATSMDTCFSIWKIPQQPEDNLECMQYESINSLLLTGGVFLDKDGMAFGVTAYDLSDVIIYSFNE